MPSPAWYAAAPEDSRYSQVEVVRPIGKPRHPLVFFYSFRSPYSQLAVDRVYDIARHYGACPSVLNGHRVYIWG